MLICRLYLGLMRTITDDYALSLRPTVTAWPIEPSAYIFLWTVTCSLVRASQKLPRISVVRRLNELIKHGYVERVGNAYRVTDKVNIPARRNCELNAGAQ